jgi:hypothetical protein
MIMFYPGRVEESSQYGCCQGLLLLPDGQGIHYPCWGLGKEHRQATKRRAWVKREEERIQEDRRAFWHANARARGLNEGSFNH